MGNSSGALQVDPIENCEMALFAGLDNAENMSQTYGEVEEILTVI